MPMSSPGVASADPFYCKPAAFKYPELFQGFQSILRTGWSKPALRTKQRGDRKLVKSYQQNEREGYYLNEVFQFFSIEVFSTASTNFLIIVRTFSLMSSNWGNSFPI